MQPHHYSFNRFLPHCLVILNLALLTLINVSTVSAQSLGFTIIPSSAFVTAAAGSTVEHPITLVNTSDRTMQVQPRVVDFAGDDETGIPVLRNESSFPYFSQSTQTMMTNSFTLFPNQTFVFTVEMEIPEDALTQEYPLSVIFESVPTDNEVKGVGSLVSGAIASNLVVLVTNGSPPSSQITSATINMPRIVDSFQSISYSISLHNDSQSAAYASGSAVIKNVFEEEVARQAINPDIVLSKNKRLARLPLTEEMLTSISVFKYDEPFLLGPYFVSFEQLNPDGTTRVIAEKTVIALPLVVFVSLFLASVVGWLWRKRASLLKHKDTQHTQ